MTRTELAYEIARCNRRIAKYAEDETTVRGALEISLAAATASLAAGGSATTALWGAANLSSRLETAIAVLKAEREELAGLQAELAVAS